MFGAAVGTEFRNLVGIVKFVIFVKDIQVERLHKHFFERSLEFMGEFWCGARQTEILSL